MATKAKKTTGSQAGKGNRGKTIDHFHSDVSSFEIYPGITFDVM